MKAWHSVHLPIRNLLFSLVEIAAQIKEDQLPDFFGWIERMKATEAVKKSYLPPEAHAAFFKLMQATGTHDYSHADVTGEGITIYAKKEWNLYGWKNYWEFMHGYWLIFYFSVHSDIHICLAINFILCD